MCGRYVRRSDKQKLAEHFRAQPNPPELPIPDADYNVAPTTHQPIIRQSKDTGNRELVLARWGLVPFFTKDLKDVKGLSTINARSETISKAPTWREPFRKRRCLVCRRRLRSFESFRRRTSDGWRDNRFEYAKRWILR